MRNLALFVGIFALAGCSSSKKTKSEIPANNEKPAVRMRKPAVSDEFSEGPAGPVKKPARKNETRNASITGGSEKSFGQLQFKYAILLDVPVEEVDDEKLFTFIESWYGAPYRYGGFSRDGVDCSGFTQALMSNIYQVNLPRISAEQYNQSKRISRKQLSEGDLVFFKTNGSTISHVGVYLRNNKFVHASTSGGVMINDLSDDYYARRFAGAGRVR